ncbi:MAG: hypothetical protein AVDCRST_MAG77-4960 [uncultured Chloroflexi bacterium]|uniref:Uncharacterized protein n=1 Tax=uncultured Chloroflexota bacterium TaxID=166587 RepID=A0A6J4K2N2_9CHLR|nr:MAG: hypothetical protein AVDCRST_MAG77-4960 [uncultured Chloroflexota bacterium]
MAEQANADLQVQQEAAQRTENVRAETINRERERYGYERGDARRKEAAALIPGVRSDAFLGQQANMTNAWASGKPAQNVAFTPESFRPDPGQVPNLDAMAAQETARVLAHISPAAAAQMGRPMPTLPPLTDLESMLQPYGAGTGTPA